MADDASLASLEEKGDTLGPIDVPPQSTPKPSRPGSASAAASASTKAGSVNGSRPGSVGIGSNGETPRSTVTASRPDSAVSNISATSGTGSEWSRGQLTRRDTAKKPEVKYQDLPEDMELTPEFVKMGEEYEALIYQHNHMRRAIDVRTTRIEFKKQEAHDALKAKIEAKMKSKEDVRTFLSACIYARFVHVPPVSLSLHPTLTS